MPAGKPDRGPPLSAAPDDELAASRMSLIDHLTELRWRIIRSLLYWAAGFAAATCFSRRLFSWLVAPLLSSLPEDQRTLVFTGVSEAFFIYFKVGMLGGLALASPFIFRELWMFVAPGLYRRERRYALPFVFISTALFLGGAAFGYLQVFPVGFRFFMSFASPELQPMLRIREYFGFSTRLLLGFGAVFEMPVLIFFLARLGVVTPQMLARQRRYAILAIVIVAAVLTPPDIVSQIMMALPMIVLYEAGILVARLFGLPPAVRAERDAQRRAARQARRTRRARKDTGEPAE